MKARLAAAATLAMLTALVLTATASASEPLEDGDYVIALPDGDILFTIAEDGEMLTVTSLPDGYAVSEDDSSDTDSTEIVGNGVTVEIETGEDGKIEIEGVSFGEEPVEARLPGVDDPITITVSGDDIVVSAPEPFRVVDFDPDGDEVEVTITDGTRTFEIEVDLEDGSVEIKRKDDDDSSSDDESSVDSVDGTTVPTVAGTDDDDSSDEDDDSSDDESSDDASDTTVTTETTASTTATTTETTPDDDSSSDDDSSDDDSSD